MTTITTTKGLVDPDAARDLLVIWLFGDTAVVVAAGG
jgi:hypothetical protein